MDGFSTDKIVKQIKEQVDTGKLSVCEQYLLSPYYKKIMSLLKEQSELVIAGSGVEGQKLCELIRLEGIGDRIRCFCDNSRERQELNVCGITVLSVGEAVCKYPEACFIITPRMYENELLRQLAGLGVSMDRIIVSINEYALCHTEHIGYRCPYYSSG